MKELRVAGLSSSPQPTSSGRWARHGLRFLVDLLGKSPARRVPGGSSVHQAQKVRRRGVGLALANTLPLSSFL